MGRMDSGLVGASGAVMAVVFLAAMQGSHGAGSSAVAANRTLGQAGNGDDPGGVGPAG